MTVAARRPLARRAAALALLAASLTACATAPAATGEGMPSTAIADRGLNGISESYVKLALALGVWDGDYVDAYYGPAEWRTAAAADSLPLAQIATRASALRIALAAVPATGLDSLSLLRREYLGKQLQAMEARIGFVGGTRLSFDDESRAMYDAVAPARDEAYYRDALARLDAALPGAGTTAQRYEAFRAAFVIPRAKLDTVFTAAIAACRERTARRVTLPPGERFTVEYVTDKPWSGYNWYQGDYRSVIQVNTDLPIFIDRAVTLACHEGYPGHHVYNAMLEQALVRGRGWMEFAVYPLFSPQSLIAEGSANFGVEMAFPGDERTAYERDVLYPLAGLDPARAAEYSRVQALAKALSFAENEAARRYVNGEIDAAAAAEWLTRYALMEPSRAQQRVRFIDKYRSYVINYNLGEDLVRQYVDAHGGTSDAARRWAVFAGLLSSPRLPSGLR